MILITGGAGYIGSHTVNFLSQRAEEVAVVDNFQKGHKKSVEAIRCYPLDVRDQEGLNRVFQEHEVEAVVHFAADSLVAESMEKPFHITITMSMA